MFNYKELEQYINANEVTKRFFPVSAQEILAAEEVLGFALPIGLKDFYLEVGFGWLSSDDRPDLRNLILHPVDVVDLYRGTSEFCELEGFLEGDLPVMDCGWDRFLVMRANTSDEKIYRDDGSDNSLAQSFNELVERLFKDAGFYEGRK